MNDKEKIEAIEKIINKKAEEMDDPPVARGTSTSLPKDLWTDIPEYKKILKNTVEDFISFVEDPDYEELENISKLKKEITEHFDKFFKDPEFDRLMSKAAD